MFWKKKTAPSSQTIGQWGETLALHYLVGRGCAILETNYRKRYGEIDIIARDGKVLVFIEVKCRTRTTFGSPLEAVDLRKQHRICRVAMEYLQSHPEGACMARFDVIAVRSQPGDAAPELEHIENAFDFSL